MVGSVNHIDYMDSVIMSTLLSHAIYNRPMYRRVISTIYRHIKPTINRQII